MNRSSFNHLRLHRRRSGLSQNEVGLLLGYRDGEMIGYYERSQRPPNIAVAFGYEALFGATPRDLFPDMYERVEHLIVNNAAHVRAGIEDRQILEWKVQLLTKLVERAEQHSDAV
jgi:transcriptional regulator with XRE-family HTH domain